MQIYNRMDSKHLMLFAVCLNLQCANTYADDGSAVPAVETDSNKVSKKVTRTIPVDEEFLMFLADFDSSNGLDIDPLDMLAIEIEEIEQPKKTKVEKTMSQEINSTAKSEENK